MPVNFTIHTEAAPLARASGANEAPALGVTWFVSATYTPGSIVNEQQRDALKAILSPWEWTNLEFLATNTTLGPPLPLPAALPTDPNIPELKTMLARMIDVLVDDPAKLSLADDDEDESDPHWPLALMQLSRSDPRISHSLQLARLFEADFPTTNALSGARLSEFKLLGVTVPCPDQGATTQVTIQGLVIDISQQLENVWSVDDIRQQGRLLDGYSRVVGSKGETRRDWLNGLAASLGRAISPVLRLADLLDQGLVGDRPTLAKRALTVLVEALVDHGTAGRITPLSLLFGESSLGSFRIWENRIGAWVATIVDKLYKEFLVASFGPEALRNTVQSEAFGSALAQALIDLAPADLAGRASQTLRDPRNMAALLDTLAVGALARRKLAPLLAHEAGKDQQLDAGPLLDAFRDQFPGVLAGLLGIDPVAAKAPLDAVTAAQRSSLEAELEELDGLDAAQDAGIAFRVDTVFKTDGTVGEPDIHATLDGALVAIRRSASGLGRNVLKPEDVTDWNDFTLASRGKVKAAFAAAIAAPAPVEADLGLLTTPVPVGLVEDYTDAAETTKAQQAIQRFFGHVLTPRSDLEAPNPTEHKDSALTLTYRGDGPELKLDLDLAYGRVFHVEVGYQSLAGALPVDWCLPSEPFTFRADLLAAGGVTRKQVALLRTKPPGPPELADQASPERPSSGLTGPRDHEVRPLWRERVAGWTDASHRRRIQTCSTVYLDAFTETSKRRSFFLLPPNLTEKGKYEQTDSERIWDYWVKRDEDVKVKSPLRNGRAPDPAVVGLAQGQPGPTGGVIIRLMEVGQAGLVDVASSKILFDGQPAIEVNLSCEENAVPAILPGSPTVISLPPSGIFAVEFQTLVDAHFFLGGEDPRFDERLKDEPIETGGVITHYAFGKFGLVVECLPELDHLPAQEALWDAIKITDANGSTRCEWVAPANPLFAYVGGIETVRQSWSWDAGPIDDQLLDALPWGSAEAARPRDRQWLNVETAFFGERGISGRTAHHDISATSDPSRLFEIEARPNRGADYLRVRATAISRYVALREDDLVLKPRLRCQARAGDGSLDIWKAVALKARRRDPLATPSVAALVPMFGMIEGGNASAGDWCAYIDHPLYDANNGGGFAERIVAEIVVEHLDHCLDPDGEGESAALSVGTDPTLSSLDNSFEAGAGAPARYAYKPKNGQYQPPITDDVWNPENRIGAMVPAKAVLGQTLEPNSSAPIVPYSIAFFSAAIGRHRLSPGTMIKVRLRLEAVPARIELVSATNAQPDLERAAATFHSPWSAVRWIMVSANTDYENFFEPPVYDPSEGALRLKFVGANPADPCFLRLKALIGDSAPNAGAPYLVQGLTAAIGNVVGDLRGDDVIRPIDGIGSGHGSLLEGRLDGNDLLFACQPPSSGDHFLRALEMRTVSLPAPPAPSLDTILPDGSNDAEGHLVAIGPLWRFQVP